MKGDGCGESAVENRYICRMRWIGIIAMFLMSAAGLEAGVLDKRKMLERQTFWDNRDWDWYEANIPFFESPDTEIDTTYYYRWELVTKHLIYGSPESGYAFTEFIDRPFWSGRYGAISCPAGHQLYEVRWLKDGDYARDYARYWFRTEGAQPRRYATWLADAIWAVAMAQGGQGDEAFASVLLDDLIKNYQGWEKSHFSPEVGLFWQNGHDEGMEYNITSRQTQDIVRGGPGYRPSMNAYMYGDALAISRIAGLAGKADVEKEFAAKAQRLKENVQKMLWDPKREFFFHVFKQDERSKEGDLVRAMSKVHESGKFAGSEHGREEIGFVPWQFNLPDDRRGHEAAWKFLMDPNYFFAEYGPTTAERNDPMFLVTKSCCWWSGQSWPYATTQTLVAMANLLNNYKQSVVSKDDYVKLLKVYTRTHRKDGRPYIAEGANPDTGSWEGYDSYNHSEHYFHSGYTDLIITGLAGLRPRGDDMIEVNPLAPDSWDYFCLDDVGYRGRRVSIVWDKPGQRYKLGAGLRVLVDGKEVASSPALGKLTAPLPATPPPAQNAQKRRRPLNYAVNNDGTAFPRAIASYTSERSDLSKVNDGQYLYHIAPPNRWSCEGSPAASDWVGIDFGIARPIHTVKLYVLDDGGEVRGIAAPEKIELEYWDGKTWNSVPGQQRSPQKPAGHRANMIPFPLIQAEKIRAVLTHRRDSRSGLSEFEAWGDGELPVEVAPPPKGNLALNVSGAGFPKASASFTSPYDKLEEANDGKILFTPNPRNRWTSFGSKNKTDWLEIDFGEEKAAGRVTLHVFDDRGGVQAPASYTVQYWDGREFQECDRQVKNPKRPADGKVNEVTFLPVKTAKVRVVFTHRGEARSGVTEMEVWGE
jgi:hypothetical protein